MNSRGVTLIEHQQDHARALFLTVACKEEGDTHFFRECYVKHFINIIVSHDLGRIFPYFGNVCTNKANQLR